MPGPFSFSAESESKVGTCNQRIQRVMQMAIKVIDFKVIYGHRTVAEQKALYDKGYSKLDGVTKKSKHNYQPARAVDIAPYPVLWPDEEGITAEEALHRARRFDVLAGIVMGIAHAMGVALRWGGDWDRDWQYNDQRFHDLGHFEDMTELPT
jgi:hypothetical protein